MSACLQVSVPMLPSPLKIAVPCRSATSRCSTYFPGLTSASTTSPTLISVGIASTALSLSCSRNGRILHPRNGMVTVCPSSRSLIISGKIWSLGSCMLSIVSKLCYGVVAHFCCLSVRPAVHGVYWCGGDDLCDSLYSMVEEFFVPPHSCACRQ